MAIGGSTGTGTPVGATWKKDPDEHDYPAAISYLSLLADKATVEGIVKGLQKTETVTFKAKDLLRASGLQLLPLDNFHVARDLAKVIRGKALSPVLVVRGDLARGSAMQIADGYHRICASYHLDENTDIPCRIAERPRA